MNPQYDALLEVSIYELKANPNSLAREPYAIP